jgi:hypothetical protein
VSRPKGADLFDVSDWNAHQPQGTSVSAYTARGGSVTTPPGVASPGPTDPHWCEARPDPTGGPRWSSGRVAIVRRYTVVAQPDPCPQTKLPVGATAGEVVVASKMTSGVSNTVKALSVGQTVKVSTRFNGWPGVTDVMGAGIMLVDRGANVAPPYAAGDPYIYTYNPRTAAGLTKGLLRHRSDDVVQAAPADDRRSSEVQRLVVRARFPFLADRLIAAGAVDGGQPGRRRLHVDVGQEDEQSPPNQNDGRILAVWRSCSRS